MTRILCSAIVASALAAPAAFAQSGGVTIKPYTGPPVYLDEGEAPPPPQVVSPREKAKENYPSGAVRFEREVARYSDNSYVNNGEYKEYYEAGGLFVEGQYDLGERTGEWIYYHDNGEVAKKVTYVDGEPDGKIDTRRADGTLEATREYDAGKRVGVWQFFDDSGEKMFREERYTAGQPDGVWKMWYPSGQQWRETPFKEGQRHGVAKEWNDDGTPKLEAEFKEGDRDGLTVEWNREGEKRERRFAKGKLLLEKPDSE